MSNHSSRRRVRLASVVTAGAITAATLGGAPSAFAQDEVKPTAEAIADAPSMNAVTTASEFTPAHGEALRLYRAFFDRNPDLDGAKHWIGASDAGRSIDEIAEFFSQSPEFANNFAQSSDREFLETVYQNVLDRDFDQVGFDYWLDLLETNQLTRGGVVRWVAANDEFITANRFPGETQDAAPVEFTVTIENVSTPETLNAGDGTVPVPLSPGAYIVHRANSNPLLGGGASLETLAEDGSPAGFDTAVPGAMIFNTPDGADAPGPAFPGDSYSFTITASPGAELSLATMFVQSNDWFYTTDDANNDAIELFNEAGAPVSGDFSSALNLWDSGTEIDQVPGVGADQAPRQSAPNTGAADPNTTVRAVADADEPDLNGPVVKLTITPNVTPTRFRAVISNVGNAESLPITDGAVPVPFAPGAYKVSGMGSTSLFTAGEASGPALEALAEDGNASLYPDEVSGSAVFNTPDGADAPGPLLPGNSYSFEFEAIPGQGLSLATMFVQSNDWFYANPEAIGLFDVNGQPVDGDFTSALELWDSGTEVDQPAGEGADQAPRQAGPNTGADEGGVVRPVDVRPTLNGEIIQLTITPVS